MKLSKIAAHVKDALLLGKSYKSKDYLMEMTGYSLSAVDKGLTELRDLYVLWSVKVKVTACKKAFTVYYLTE